MTSRQSVFWKHLLYTLAASMIVVGLWQHDLRMILAAASVYYIWPLISMDLFAEVDCLGCTKGRIVPGCPVHDQELRKNPERRRNGEAMFPPEGKAS